jgi:hypothetical protein
MRKGKFLSPQADRFVAIMRDATKKKLKRAGKLGITPEEE